MTGYNIDQQLVIQSFNSHLAFYFWVFSQRRLNQTDWPDHMQPHLYHDLHPAVRQQAMINIYSF